MENFSTDNKPVRDVNSNNLDENATFEIKVSPVCSNQAGEKYAFVTFSDGKRTAEGKIPECVMISREGFSDEEISALEDYMRANRTKLKSMAAGIDIMSAFMGKGNDLK